MRRTLLTLLRLGFGVGLLIFLEKSKVLDFHSLGKLISAWPLTVAALALLVFDLILMSWRLCCLFWAGGLRLAWRDSFQLTSVSAFFASFLPGRAGSDLAKIFYASKGNSGRRAEIITVLLFDRLVGLFSLLLLPWLFLPIFPGALRLPALRAGLLTVAFLALALLAAFLVALSAPARIERWTALPRRFWPKMSIFLRSLRTVAGYRDHSAALIGALGISLADNVMSLGVLALALMVVEPASISAKLLVMVPIGQVINSLPLTPGGLGVGEAAFHSLFRSAGLRGGAEALLCWRIWNALVGMLGLIFYVRGFRTHIPELGPAKTPGAATGPIFPSSRVAERRIPGPP